MSQPDAKQPTLRDGDRVFVSPIANSVYSLFSGIVVDVGATIAVRFYDGAIERYHPEALQLMERRVVVEGDSA